MSSPARARVYVTLVTSLLAALLVLPAPTSAHQQLKDRETPSPALPVSSGDLGLSHGAVVSYWTKERRRSAIRLDRTLTLGAPRATTTLPSTPAGAPGYVGPEQPTVPAPSRSLVRTPSRRAGNSSARYEIVDTATYPYSTNGKIFMTDPSTGYDYVCSGTAVTSTNKSLVVTAGHCVHGGGTSQPWHTNFMFVPGYRLGEAPLGSWIAESLSSTTGWVESGDFSFDMGAAVMQPDAANQLLTDVVGSRGIAWNIASEQFFRAFGYPAAPPFDGERQFVCDSQFLGSDPSPSTPPAPISIGCDMTGGSSGGGWIVEDTYLNSVNSYGYTSQPDVMYGPYFGDAARLLYESTQGGGEPTTVTHQVAVTILLKRHLVVKGTMTASDDYQPCTRNAPIDVQRKRQGRWVGVTTVYTDDYGAYKARVKDRAGAYRVKSPEGSVDAGNLCSAAISGTRRHRH